jgi:hypothetical protein
MVVLEERPTEQPSTRRMGRVTLYNVSSAFLLKIKYLNGVLNSSRL